MQRPNDIVMYRGDTEDFKIRFMDKNTGLPWTPTDETVMLSVGYFHDPLIMIPVVDGVARFEHEHTQDMRPGNYTYDIRIYDENLTLVNTVGTYNFTLLEVVNHKLL